MSENDLDVVTVGEWALALFANESERRVLDVELAERLGIAQARNIRQLIKNHSVDLSKFGEVVVRTSVVRTKIPGKNEVSRSVNEFWLNKDQALYIALKSDTPKANEISVALVLAFRELERRALAESSKMTRQELIYSKMLLTQHTDRRTLWTQDVPRELSRIYEWDLSKVKGYPPWMGNITANIYDLIVGKDVMDEARTRRDKSMKRGQRIEEEDDGLGGRTMLYQWFSDETRQHFEQKIPIVIVLIRTSNSVDDFWNRMDLEFGQSMLQLQIAFAAEGCCARCGVPLEPKSRFCNQCGARVAGRLSA